MSYVLTVAFTYLASSHHLGSCGITRGAVLDLLWFAVIAGLSFCSATFIGHWHYFDFFPLQPQAFRRAITFSVFF
jgi:hypothetical protein